MYSNALQNLLQQIDTTSESPSTVDVVIKENSLETPKQSTGKVTYFSSKKSVTTSVPEHVTESVPVTVPVTESVHMPVTVPVHVPVTVPVVNHPEVLPLAEYKQRITFKQERKKKIVLVSTHVHQYNGYSKVSWNILKLLSTDDSFELYHYAAQKAAGTEFRSIPSNVHVRACPPIDGGFDFAGLPLYLEEVKPDIVIIYNDANIVSLYLEQIGSLYNKQFKTIVYLDQVYYSMRPQHVIMLNEMVDEIFVFTAGWKEKLLEFGIKKPIGVMRHGFDKTAHTVIDKSVARANLGLPIEPFYIVNVNRNTPRKRLDTLIIAFVRYVCNNPESDVRLVCACDLGNLGGGYPLLEIYEHEIHRLGGDMKKHGEKLIILNGSLMLTDDDINLLYNAADCGVTCSDAEGFGLCAFEMMGLGKPQIVSDQIGHREFCKPDNSFIVPANHKYYITLSSSSVCGEAHGVTVDDLYKGLVLYTAHPAVLAAHGEVARNTVLEYSWSAVCSEFIARLKAL